MVASLRDRRAQMTALARTPDAVPWDSPTVRVVFAATALAPLGVPLVSPALPVVRDAFGLTDAEASLLVSAYFLTGIVLSPFVGLVADRLGRRRVLAPSLAVLSLAGTAIAFSPDFGVVVGVRLVQGTAAAGISVTTVTLVGDAFEGVQRNAVLGVNTAVLATGAAVYPLPGGYLATISWNAPFLVYSSRSRSRRSRGTLSTNRRPSEGTGAERPTSARPPRRSPAATRSSPTAPPP